VHDRKICGQGKDEGDDQEGENAEREIGYLTPGCVADLGFAFMNEPTGA